MDSIYLNTGTALAAAAINRAFPSAIWANYGARGDFFFLDFFFSGPFNEKITLEVVQQSLRDLLDSQPAILSKEMLWGNAQAYIKHARGSSPESVQETDPRELVSLLEINGAPFLASQPTLSSITELDACRICQMETLPAEFPSSEGTRSVRFWGVALGDKKDLSSLQKKLQKALRNNPSSTASHLNLLVPPENDDQLWLWLPKGRVWRQELLQLIAAASGAEEIEGFSADGSDPDEEILLQHLLCFVHAVKGGARLPMTFGQQRTLVLDPVPFQSGWGLYDCHTQTGFVGHSFFFEADSQEGVISSLQRIEKTYKMLGVEYYWVFRFPKPKGVFEPAIWNKKKRCLEEALKSCGLQGETLSGIEGQTGPQAELMACDSFGKAWKLASVTVEALGQPIVDEYLQCSVKGFKQSVTVVRTSFLESLERLCAFLLEGKAEAAILPLSMRP